MGTATAPNFRVWLRQQIDRRRIEDANYGVRTLARKMAEKHPEGVTFKTVETYRRTLNKYLAGESNPSQTMRAAVADALGVDRESLPPEDEEPDPLARLIRLRREEERILRDLSPAAMATKKTAFRREVIA